MTTNEVALNEVMKETADAIREKTGKSELIKPVNFAEEIKGINAGGGDAPSGGSNWRYFDVRGINGSYGSAERDIKKNLCKLAQFANESGVVIVPEFFLGNDSITIEAIAYAWDMEIVIPAIPDALNIKTLGDYVEYMVSSFDIDWSRIPEITKEQFYDLNA